MYIHLMIRTQVYLDENVHARLTELARRQRRTLSDLVRDALTRTYGVGNVDERLRTLRAIEGLWRDRTDIPDTDEYVRQLRNDKGRRKRLAKV